LRLQIQVDEKSAFRPSGRDSVEFFNNTGWAFSVQVAVPMRLPDGGQPIYWMSHAVTSRIVFELVFHALTSGITTAPTPIR
jgi:hypothetical protein